MNDSQFRDVSETVLASLSEAEMAQWCLEQGACVSRHHGRYWLKTHWGFYQSVHWLACLKADEAIKPSLSCWGFRATLHAEAAAAANGTMPVYLLSDLPAYSMEHLPAKRRTDLRKCRNQVRIVQVMDPQILTSQGYDVAVSAAVRTGRGRPSGRDQYMASIDGVVRNRRRIVLAGLVGESLAGYLTGYAVENVAYIETVMLATEHLPTAVGTGLVFDFVQICRRQPALQQVVYGQHSIEDSKLTVFKEGMGFPVTNIPCRAWIAPILKSYIRWRYPHKFYRLTGETPL
jgi:hypothetical protein